MLQINSGLMSVLNDFFETKILAPKFGTCLEKYGRVVTVNYEVFLRTARQECETRQSFLVSLLRMHLSNHMSFCS